MRISDMAVMLLQNRRFEKQNNTQSQPNGSSPPAGHVNPFEDPYLNITGKSPSEWQKTVPVDDEVAEKLRNLIREDFTQRNGMCGTGQQADAQANIIKSYVAHASRRAEALRHLFLRTDCFSRGRTAGSKNQGEKPGLAVRSIF